MSHPTYVISLYPQAKWYVLIRYTYLIPLTCLNQSENSHKFEFVVCCSSDPEVKNGKPHPDAFDIARKRFDPVPEARKCLAFEDSINGVKSAISQGSRIFESVRWSRIAGTIKKNSFKCRNAMCNGSGSKIDPGPVQRGNHHLKIFGRFQTRVIWTP